MVPGRAIGATDGKAKRLKIHPDAHEGIVGVGRANVRYYDTGRPGDGRTPIVLLHGTGGTGPTHFRTLYPMLAARHRVIALDFSDVSPREALKVEHLVLQAAAVIHERAPHCPIHLVGYSLGAVVAAALAADHPELVDSLVLVAGWMRTDSQQLLRNSLWQNLFETDEEALKEYMTLMSYSSRFLASRPYNEVRTLVRNRTLLDGIKRQMELNRTIDISSKVLLISAPTLVVGGTYDQMAPMRHSQLLLGAIENARLAEIPSGHAVPIERPAHLFKLIDDFIADPAALSAGAVVEKVAV
jgi:pimeloyl-ACP methyl ester carboxylesterase